MVRVPPRLPGSSPIAPWENMTQVGDFLVSLHHGMISIPVPQGFLGCYQVQALPGSVSEEEPGDNCPVSTTVASEAACGLWPVSSFIICVLSTFCVPGPVLGAGGQRP